MKSVFVCTFFFFFITQFSFGTTALVNATLNEHLLFCLIDALGDSVEHIFCAVNQSADSSYKYDQVTYIPVLPDQSWCDIMNLLLVHARAKGDAQFMVLEPDLFLSSSCIEDRILKDLFDGIHPGQVITFPVIDIDSQTLAMAPMTDTMVIGFSDDGTVYFSEKDFLKSNVHSLEFIDLKAKHHDTRYAILRLNHFAHVAQALKPLPFLFISYYLSKLNHQLLSTVEPAEEKRFMTACKKEGIVPMAQAYQKSLWRFSFVRHLGQKEDLMMSQYGQDNLIDTFVTGKKEHGFFIDIGAHDGKKLNNTYFFEKTRGWKGLCIEPLKDAFEQLKKNRSALCINGAVYTHDGHEDFYRIEGEPEQLSGLVKTYNLHHKKRMTNEIAATSSTLSIEIVSVFRLDTLLKEYQIDYVDFLSLDTEGSEFEIIKNINFDKCFIRSMSVENMYHGQDLRDYLKTKGFLFLTRLHNCDDIFINLNVR